MKNDKLTKAFVKLMTDLGATFIDVTPERKKPRTQAGKKLFTKAKSVVA